jgi:hypothetical protein
MKFNSDSLDILRSKMENLLKDFGLDNEIEFKMGRIGYTEGYCTIALKAYSTEKVGPANVAGKDMEFLNSALRLGVPSDWLGKKVTMSGTAYTITGLNTRARKYPVILTRMNDGASIKSTVDSVRRGAIQ